MAAELTEIIVDAADPRRLGEFWSAVLGWAPTDVEEGLVEVAPPAGGRPTLVFVPVDEPKQGKNRVHLDLNPRGCDQAEELERLLELGARRVDIGQGQPPWVVLADPEGNEFCLLRSRVD